MQHVVLGALVMLIEKIDLKVGATNGTIGIITKLEFNLKDNVYNIFVAFNPSRYMLQNIISFNIMLCNYKAQIPKCNDIIQSNDTYL